MKNAKTFTVICSLALVIGGLGWKSFSPTQGKTGAPQRPSHNTVPTTAGTKQSPNPSQAPEHVVYRQFFHHLAALKQRAADAESHGKSGTALREHYKAKIGLKDKDADLLDQIAAECDRETAKVDAKAQNIIDGIRRRFPNGKMESPEELPPPPLELKTLQLKRDMIVMRARHRLVTELGAQGFQQIDDFIKLNFSREVQPAAVNPKPSGTSQSGANQ